MINRMCAAKIINTYQFINKIRRRDCLKKLFSFAVYLVFMHTTKSLSVKIDMYMWIKMRHPQQENEHFEYIGLDILSKALNNVSLMGKMNGFLTLWKFIIENFHSRVFKLGGYFYIIQIILFCNTIEMPSRSALFITNSNRFYSKNSFKYVFS